HPGSVTHLSFDSTACALAHGSVDPAPDGRALVAIFESPVANHLLHIAATLGYRVALIDPRHGPVDWSPVEVNTDVVVTDHDRPAGRGPRRASRTGSGTRAG